MHNVLRVFGVALVIAACGPTEMTSPDGGRAGGAGGGASMDAGATGGGTAGGTAGGAAGGSAGGAAPVVSFASQVGPLIVARCGTCHGPTTVTEADTFVRGASVSCGGTRITAGNAMTSLLFQKISGTQTCGAQMPLGCTPGTNCLPTVQLELIRDWLNAGAPNN